MKPIAPRHRNLLVFTLLTTAFVLVCAWLSGMAAENRYLLRAFDSDESGIVMVLEKMYVDRLWQPLLYNYGTAHTYLSLVLLYLLGLVKQPTFAEIAVVARMLNAAALAGVGWLFWRYGSCRGSLKWSSLFLLCLLFGGLNFHYAVNGKPEHLQTFFLVCAMMSLRPFFDDQRLCRLFWTGLFAGLAIATKYMGLFLLAYAALVLLVFALVRRDERPQPLRYVQWLALLALGSAAGVLLLGPYLVIDYTEVRKVLEFVSRATAQGFLALDGKHWTDWLTLLFGRDALWWALAVGALPGLVLFVGRKENRVAGRAGFWLNLGWGGFYLVYLLAFARETAPRYLLILLPFWLDVVFGSLREGEEWLRAQGRASLGKALFGGVLALTLFASGSGAWNVAAGMLERQTAPRVIAGDWLKEHVRHTALVAYDLYTYVPPEFTRRFHENYLTAFDIIETRPDVLVSSRQIMTRYLDADRARHYPYGEDAYMAHHMLYAQLEADVFPGYRLQEDFGEVRIYLKARR